MSDRREIFLFGASGHAKVVADIVEREGRARLCFLVDDDPDRKDCRLFGHRVIGGRPELLARRAEAGAAIVAIGANPARRAVADWLVSEGFSFARALHPSAQIGREVRIAAGSVVMAGAVINPDCEIGMHCIVNTAASVDHDCRLNDGVHVAPGARLCGGVSVGRGAFIGAGAVVLPGRSVGADAIIAAGAIVLADVPDNAIVTGNPAKLVRSNESSRGSG